MKNIIITKDQENHLVQLEEKCEKHPHPYNAMIFGMWCEEYGFSRNSNPFDGKSNHPLYNWFFEGWQASRDAKIMLGEITFIKNKK